MSDADEETWRARLASAANVRVRTGSDPRWRKVGDKSEMGVMSGLGWATWLAEVGVTPRLVPGEYWALDAEEAGTRIDRISGKDVPVVARVAIVSCPCGRQPVVRELAMLVRCECGRSFFFGGDDVWCFNTKPPEPFHTHRWTLADGGTIVAP